MLVNNVNCSYDVKYEGGSVKRRRAFSARPRGASRMIGAMGTKERRDREKRELRDKILDAARELFAEHGYEAVTMRRIAERVEYSPTAIYLHFKDKDELIRELVTADFAAFSSVFGKVARIGDPVDRLRAAGRAYIEFGLAHPHHYRLLFESPLPTDHADTSPDSSGYLFLRGIVAEAVAAGRFRPELEDVELTAQLCWAGVHGITSLVLGRHGGGNIEWRDREALVAAMLDVLVRGCVRD
jgi:AcrR family transcriptional regulator